VHTATKHCDECRQALGQRVLDVGCGFGDTTQRIAGLVGPEGEAVGVDAAARFIDTAREEAAEAGVSNARFLGGWCFSGELDLVLDFGHQIRWTDPPKGRRRAYRASFFETRLRLLGDGSLAPVS